MIDKTAKIERRILINAEINYCCSYFDRSYVKYVNTCLDYQRCQEQGELEDWEREQWQRLIDEAWEEAECSKRILTLLKECYPQHFFMGGDSVEIDNAAWNALISALNVTKGDSKQAKALFEMWLKDNYYWDAYKEGWLECCDYNDIDYDGYLEDDDGY